MKKIIFSLSALAALLLAGSCQRENLEPVEQGGTVTYTVQVPEALATKAANGFELLYEVYRQDNTLVYESDAPIAFDQEGKVQLSLDFVKDQTFTVLFWAQNSGCTAYNVGDLRSVTLAGNLKANDENAEAFAGKDVVTNCVSAAENGNVVLVRPIAQLNIATLTSGLTLGNTSTVKPEYSDLKVTGLYSAYNVATGEVIGDAGEVSYVKSAIKANDIFNSDYTRVGMNYVGFMPKEGANVDVDFNIYTEIDGDISHKVSNVPVKPNFKTNIIGNLISATDNYQVTLKDWGTPDTNVEVVAVSTAQDLQEAIDNIQPGAEGNIILEGDIDLGALFGASTLSVTKTGNAQLPIVISENKAVTLDLNGFTITTSWDEETAGKHHYAFENYGTLNIVDSKVNGKIKARGIFNYGKMTLESGTIDACDGNGGYGVRNYEGAEFVMNGGSIITSLEDDNQVDKGGYDATTLRVDEGATATINAGTINNICDFTYAIDNHGTVTVNGGEFNSVHSTVSTYGTMAINGGSFICDGIEGITAHCLVAWEGSQTTINGGTFNGKDNYNGFNVDAAEGATVYIKGGEFLPVHSGSLYGDGTIIVTGGTFFDQVPAKYLAAGYSCQQNEEGKWIVPQVALAKIGEVSYPTLAAAIDAVSEDAPATITVQAAVFTDESIVIPAGKSITLDLNGMTIIGTMPRGIGVVENNGTLTIQNGTISSTAENGGSAISNNGTLTITDAIVNGAPSNTATGTASYAVNSQGAGSKLVVYNSTINGRGAVGATKGTNVTINGGAYHTPAVAWGHAVYADGEGTEVVIKAGTFSEGYEYNGNNWGMYQIYSGNKAKVVVNGGTFEDWDCANGYDLCTASEGTIEIYGGTFAENPSNQGGKNYVADGYKAVQNADGKWKVEAKTYVAQIGNVLYESLQEAIDEVNEGETILLCNDVTIATPAYGQNALNHARAISFTLDLNGKTLEANTGNSVFRYNITQAGATDDVTVTLKNGTITAGDNTWCVVMAAGLSDDIKAVFTLENLTINASKPGDLAVKAWDYALINAENVTVNATKGAGGFYALGGEIVLDNCTVNQKGLWTAPYLSMAVAVSNGGKATVNSGTYTAVPTAASEGDNQGSSHGSWAAGVMNSGGELIINGGTFANGNFGDDALATYARGLIFGDTASKIVINDGTFNALKSIIDYQNNLGVQPNPNIIINGGDFSADPSVVASYGGVVIKEGYAPYQGANGRWTLVKAQPNNEIWYTSYDNTIVYPTSSNAFDGATVVSNEWNDAVGKYVMTFDAPLTTIGNEAFMRITNTTPSNWMTSISLPNNVKTIGNYAFAQCYSLTEITIPDSVETIGEYAFQSCDAATKVTIGSGVKTIASGAFYNCYEIKEITCKSTTPPVVADKWVFNGAEITKVVVPATSVDAYKAADVWKNFNIVAE